jgi:3-oxoacyl-[acyl-carrier-protein] synthase-3
MGGPAAATITGLGRSLPDAVVTNADLEAELDTSDAWIVDRTGIRERRQVGPSETTVTLGVGAGGKALADAGVHPGDVSLLIVATCTPAQRLPGDAAAIQSALGLSGGAFDLNAACSGFVYGLSVAAGMLAASPGPVLVVATETLSHIVDPDDRSTAVLFGDGAGAAVIEPGRPGSGLLGVDLGMDGTGLCHLEIPAGEQYLQMDGQEVFRFAVRKVVESCGAALDEAGLDPTDVDVFVPHQANARIIEAAGRRLGIPPDRTVVNVDRYGNTSAASIPIALSEAAEGGRLHPGDIVLLSGFGAGLSWATGVLRWGDDRP